MNPNDIQDAKVGTRQVSAIYLGDTLVWPALPMIYVITDAWLEYSSGNTINAAGSNYAYALGNVNVYRGTSLIRTMTDVHLNVSVSSQDFNITRPSGLSYDVITGNNLGTTPTSDVKTASVTASYHGDTHSAGSVTQERNIQTTTAQTVRVEDTPVITQDEVPNTRYVDLVISRYKTANNSCPAYGGTANMSYSGGHDMSNYSTTAWTDWTTLTHTFTSGSVVVDPAVITATGQYGPTAVGDPWTVSDNISAPTLPAWLTFSNGVLTFASEGTDTYQNGRYAALTATNGSASDTEIVYQQYNVPEAYDYLIAIAMDLSGDIPGEGGLFSADYESNLVTTYTSGVDTDPKAINATVTTQNCTVEESTVSGSGTLFFNVPENDSTSLSKTVRITLTASGHTAYDEATQEPLPVVVTPTAKVYPDVDTDGRVRVRLAMTQGQFPSGSVVISGMVYHYVLENQGSGTEQTRNISGDITITSDGGAVRLGGSFTWFSGTSGEHWFSATSVSRIGLSNTTFPHEVFDIM